MLGFSVFGVYVEFVVVLYDYNLVYLLENMFFVLVVGFGCWVIMVWYVLIDCVVVKVGEWVVVYGIGGIGLLVMFLVKVFGVCVVVVDIVLEKFENVL